MGLFDFAKSFLKAPPRHHLEPAPAARTPAEVRAALDTLATAPDVATYGAAWQPIYEAPADFDWAAALTPARLDGVMRQRVWMLPGAGFAEVGTAFGHLRQRLLAVQRALPAAPVAPALALHDRVFGPNPDFEDLQAGTVVHEIERRLEQAYDTLLNWLRPPKPTAAQDPVIVVETTDFQEFISIKNEAFYLVSLLEDYYSAAIYHVLPQAFPHLAGHFAQRLATSPAAGQRRLLTVAYLSPDPTLQALLRELAAASPHPDIRLLASELLTGKAS
ncbi:hypothetical protein GCM10027422_27470 [Hymenobacter arcticus]